MDPNPSTNRQFVGQDVFHLLPAPEGIYENRLCSSRFREIHYNTFIETIHADCLERGWWTDLTTGQPLKRNVGELAALIMSELVESVEKPEKPDDHLPAFYSRTVEVADACIRIADLLGWLKSPAGGGHDFYKFFLYEVEGFHPENPPRDNIHPYVLVAWGDFFESARKRPPEVWGAKLACLLARLFVFGLPETQRLILPNAIAAKQSYNLIRADHSLAARKQADGKKF